MKTKIIFINIGILVAYMLLLTAVSKGGVLVTSILPIAIHVLANFVLFIVKISSDRQAGFSYLLSAILVLLIGFPSCWWLSSISDHNGNLF